MARTNNAQNAPKALTEEERAAKIAEGEQYVEVRLFKDGGKYKDDVFVSVNGETCLVKRGVPVKIKKKFADVIYQSMDAEAKAQAREEELQQNWKTAAATL